VDYLDGEVEEHAIGPANERQLHRVHVGRVDVHEYVEDVVGVNDVDGGGLGAVGGAEGHGWKGERGAFELLFRVEVLHVNVLVKVDVVAALILAIPFVGAI